MPDVITRPLDLHCPAAALLAALATHRAPLALLSGQGGDWDILMADPVRVLTRQQGHLFVLDAHGHSQPLPDSDPFAVLQAWQQASPLPAQSLPFAGGLAGYWGYEAGLPTGHPDHSKAGPTLPELWVGDYRWALLRDHRSGRWQLVADTDSTAQAVTGWLSSATLDTTPEKTSNSLISKDFISNTSWPAYQQAFASVQHYLLDGDCYQVNLARHFSAPQSPQAPAIDTFRQLLAKHPAPYAAYLGLGPGKAVLSFSPESFLHMTASGHITTRPIKGTRPRHADPAQDTALANELQDSTKDRAENLMIVDLLRNDLGQCCEPGSIKATELFRLESHPNVHHLVSRVEGQARPGTNPLAVLKACFPGGSITGAPKKRAMDIISELEPVRRSVYCGAIGYISRDGQMNTSIAIRTLAVDGEQVHCWGGSGIVADSNAGAEYQECEDKVRVFMKALENT